MGFIGDILSAIWRVLKKVLLIVLLCLAVYFTAGGALTLFGAVFTGGWAALACLGLALLIDPGTVTEIATAVGSAVGNLSGAVIGAVAGGVAAGTGLSGIFPYLLMGGVAYLYLTREKKPETLESIQAERARSELDRDERSAAAARAYDLTPSPRLGGAL